MPIQVEGLAKLSEMLTQIAPRKARRKMREALGQGANVVQQAAEDSAPELSGFLEGHIVQKAHFEGDSDTATTTLSIDIGPAKKAYWGMFDEFGTQEVSGVTKDGKKFHHTAQPATRWLTNSWEGCKESVLDTIKFEMTALTVELENSK